MSAAQTPERNKEAVRRLYEDFLNTGELDFLDQFIAEDYMGVYGQKGPSAFADTIRALRRGFPDIQWSVEDLIAEGDRVVLRWRWQGTHRGSFRGFPASQRQVTDSAIVIYQFRDDKIVRAWIQTDRLGLLQQIGVIPPDLGSASQSATKSG